MRAHGVLTTVASLALVLGGCGGRPSPIDRTDAGTGQADASHYDGGRHDGPIHGDAGQKCDDIAGGYVALLDSFNYCNVAVDCVSFSIDCSIGAYADLGECYLPVYRSADTSQLGALVQRWAQDGCPKTECHPCPAPPSLVCQGGVCVSGSSCTPATCTSGPDECCGRDCDPSTFPICDAICAPVPPVDPVCDCPAVGGCTNVWCTSDGSCPAGSRCDPDSGVCAVIPHCEQAGVGCRPFLDHCSCSWTCVDGDANVVDCPSICDNEPQLKLEAPVCDCGLGGCGMILCEPSTGDCGFGYVCRDTPGSLGYQVCTECPNC